ncbi:hypothetical protein BBBOND_0310500 [Babesia bigemina]|uniref:Uncharacterized protein n=1 Tax=Babesia bigemina TaxID=5866 RepID=A0A061DAX6_BABBI|nr:hypothetical protein BBBOND_0310500 [Babesia bigemina]CDR97147.1 hypothetical protein BBBOND_0310500 [Babesia bigemina]|eukprot:XP_012769333.1 hypothetical protein BBBOND_0310500 [Babesia bigemina]
MASVLAALRVNERLAEGTGSGSGSVAVGECLHRLRRLGAAVVEGTGRGSGTCCSWLRGVGLGGEDDEV